MHGKESKVSDSTEKDRISSLPDEILCHILGFMPTKYAVRTSLLSTRWESIWTSVPNFDLESYSPKFYTGTDSGDDCSSFMDFVDRALLLHNSPNINRFRLHCQDGDYNPYRLNSWICTAIKRNVQELDLDLCIEFAVALPRCLFTSLSLVVLKLANDILFRLPMLVFLPSLKVLHLRSMGYLDEDFFENLLSCCPVLEVLEIDQLGLLGRDEKKTICICSSTLKKLTMSYVCPSDCSFVEIKAPALEIIRLVDRVSGVFVVDEFPSLVKAYFCVSVIGSDSERTNDIYNGVAGMLGNMYNVQHLRLTSDTLKVIVKASAYDNLPMFHNLTHLHVDITSIQWSILPELFGRMPRLEVLVLKKDGRFWRMPSLKVLVLRQECLWRAASENVPKCLPLKTINITGFVGSKEEMELVRYLLENAMVLKKLTLTSLTRDKRIRGKILNFSRGSSTCQIELRFRRQLFAQVVEWL